MVVLVAEAEEHIHHTLAFRKYLEVAGVEEGRQLPPQTPAGVELVHWEEDSQGWLFGSGLLVPGEPVVEGEVGHTVDTP